MSASGRRILVKTSNDSVTDQFPPTNISITIESNWVNTWVLIGLFKSIAHPKLTTSRNTAWSTWRSCGLSILCASIHLKTAIAWINPCELADIHDRIEHVISSHLISLKNHSDQNKSEQTIWTLEELCAALLISTNC